MEYSYKKLSPAEFTWAKDLFVWFQEDDEDPEILIPSDDYIRELLAREDFHVIVAMQGSEIVGGLTAYELPMYKAAVNEIFLYEIGVHKEHRIKGLASELIMFLKKVAAQRNIPEMYVGTHITNIPAQRLYGKTGGKLEQIAWYVYDLSS